MARVLNDLYDYSNLKIYQNTDSFKFSLDSILLAEFVEIKPSTNQIVDFCTGNAPIPLILSTKTLAKIYGFEIQKSIFDLGVLSIKINNKEKQIELFNKNVVDVVENLKPECCDIVTCNPPYFKVRNKTLLNKNIIKSIARHEIKIDINQIITKAAQILKNKGAFYLVHRPERLEEIIILLKEHKLIPKKLQFIYSDYGKNAIIVLIKAVKNGKTGLKVLKPINISAVTTYKNLVGE